MPNIDKEKLVINRDCTHCVHGKVCRHREDYLGFVNAIDEFSERCFGDKICEDVASVKVSCNYYIPMYISGEVIEDENSY